MDIAVIDCRKYGKQRKYYVLRPDAISDEFLPEPSSLNWKEVRQEDFASESLMMFFERRKK